MWVFFAQEDRGGHPPLSSIFLCHFHLKNRVKLSWEDQLPAKHPTEQVNVTPSRHFWFQFHRFIFLFSYSVHRVHRQQRRRKSVHHLCIILIAKSPHSVLFVHLFLCLSAILIRSNWGIGSLGTISCVLFIGHIECSGWLWTTFMNLLCVLLLIITIFFMLLLSHYDDPTVDDWMFNPLDVYWMYPELLSFRYTFSIRNRRQHSQQKKKKKYQPISSPV